MALTIHRFSDGQTLVLALEDILAPQFCSIEEYVGRNTPDYYVVLGEVGAGSWHPEGDAKPSRIWAR